MCRIGIKTSLTWATTAVYLSLVAIAVGLFLACPPPLRSKTGTRFDFASIALTFAVSAWIYGWLDAACLAPEDRLWMPQTFQLYSAMQILAWLMLFGTLRYFLERAK